MVPGIHNNLLSTNQFAKAKYIMIFDEKEVNIYDATNTIIKTTRGSVLRGWSLHDEGLWHILLDENVTSEFNINTKTVKSKELPSNLLISQPTPPLQSINNVYKLKIKPEKVRYYHAAEGFPKKPSWTAAIINNHYESCLRLDATTVAKYSPESDKMWKEHGRKIKYRLRSTKQLAAT